jgi:hypothetical protein
MRFGRSTSDPTSSTGRKERSHEFHRKERNLSRRHIRRPELAEPEIDLLRAEIVTPGNFRGAHSRRRRLRQNPQLVVYAPATTALPPGDDLHSDHCSIANFENRCEISFKT